MQAAAAEDRITQTGAGTMALQLRACAVLAEVPSLIPVPLLGGS